MFKNTAGQRWRVFAFDTRNNDPVEGIEANITANLTLDYGTPQATIDVNPTEDADAGGYYWFNLTADETNTDHIAINPSASNNEFTTVLGDRPSYVTDDIGSSPVSISNPIDQEMRQGADSLNADGRALYFTSDTEDEWPSLSGATVTFYAKQGSTVIVKACVITVPSGGIQAFYAEFNSEDIVDVISGALASTGNYRYHVLATLPSGNIIPLIEGGTLRIEEPYGVNYGS